jgi:hypothetical protein
MRIIIESGEKLNLASAPTATDPSQSEATNAGPPEASLFQSATVPAETSNLRDGIDAGGPPASLVQSLQGDASLAKNNGGEDTDAGAAPNV